MLNCCRGPSRPVPVFIAGGAETGHEHGDFGRTFVPFLPVPVLASTGLMLMSSGHVRTGVWSMVWRNVRSHSCFLGTR